MYEDKKKKGGGKKKGPAESVKQEKKDLNKMPGDVKQMDTPPARKKGGAKKDVMMDENMSGSGRKKGSAKKKGAAGFNSHTSDTHKHPHSEGAGRMGFTQNFGPARQNSYAQGAAKVASIMSFGASKKKGVADHIEGHLKEVSVSAPDNSGSEQRSDVVKEGLSIKEQRLNNQIAGIQKIRNLKTRDSSLVDMSSPSKAKQMFNFTISPDRSAVNEGGIINYKSPGSQGGGNERVYGGTSESDIRRNFPEKNLTGEYYNTEQADQIIKYQGLLKGNANKLK